MSTTQKLTAITLLGVAVVIVAQRRNRPPVMSRPDTVVVMRSARAETVSVQTTRVVNNTRLVLDSVFARDTLWQHDTVVRVVVESLLVQCERCARELSAFRLFADSVRVSDRDSIVKLNRALATERKRRSWWALGGLVAGVAVTR